MSENLAVFSSAAFKDIVQDLRDLMSQSNLAFLFGAGCSFKAGLPLMLGLTEEVLKNKSLSDKTMVILNSVKEYFSGSANSTIEDYMSEVVDHLSIAERRAVRGATRGTITVENNEITVIELAKALDDIKQAVAQIICEKDVDIVHHQHFVRSVHGSLQAGKPGRIVDYFVLNYDTLLEDALGLEKVDYVDGFAGAATGWWDPSVFQNEGVAARVFKIHGSIEWCLLEGDPLPRKVRAGIKRNATRKNVLIYPASTKYQETQRDPFAQLMQNMRISLRPTEREEVVLAICGYSFSDPHINLEIENALQLSAGRLTVAAFIGDTALCGTLLKWMDNPIIREQIRVYTGNAFLHGDKVIKSDNELSWWKFEVLARLLGGER
jgi:hypothetical protein